MQCVDLRKSKYPAGKTAGLAFSPESEQSGKLDMQRTTFNPNPWYL